MTMDSHLHYSDFD